MAENLAGASATRTPIPLASTYVLLDVPNLGYCDTRSSNCMDTHSVSNLSFSRLEINVIAIVICASLQEYNRNFILAPYVVWKGSHEQDGNEIAYA